VAKRIKPMIQLFYDRLKAYDAAITDTGLSKIIATKLSLDSETDFSRGLEQYGHEFFTNLQSLSLGFTFPALEK